MSSIDLQAFYGVTGAPLIEGFVEYLKDQWRVSPQLAPVAAFVSAIIWNLILGIVLLGADWKSAVMAGILTALLATGYHEATTPKKVQFI